MSFKTSDSAVGTGQGLALMRIDDKPVSGSIIDAVEGAIPVKKRIVKPVKNFMRSAFCVLSFKMRPFEDNSQNRHGT